MIGLHKKALGTILAMTMLLTLTSVATVARAATPFGPGFRSCGSFKAQYVIHVYASHIPCRKATRIQKEYWLAPEIRTEEIRSGPYKGYVRLKRFPGWRCSSGTGGGNCTKGKADAAYTDI